MRQHEKPIKTTGIPAGARARIPAYETEGVKLEFTEQIVARMEATGVTKSALAARLNVSPAYITKVLQGTTNFTLDSTVKISRALGTELHVRLKPAQTGQELPSKTIKANGIARHHRQRALQALPKAS